MDISIDFENQLWYNSKLRRCICTCAQIRGKQPLSIAAQVKEACRMLSELKSGPKVVGVKQARRALNDGRAGRVFLAEDADPRVTGPVEMLCREKGVDVVKAPSMKELGAACGIAVGAAVAALLK